jgi:UV DNA damage endonuclease
VRRWPRYRLGFAVKVLGGGGLSSHDARRWGSGPHLSRSLEFLDAIFDYLDRADIRVYRLSSNAVPYGTHPDLPQFDYRRQIESCAGQLATLGRKAARLGLRLSTHPGQYTVLDSPDPELTRTSARDVEQDALLLDALGQGPEAVVIVHVGGAYGDISGALDRWTRAWERLSGRAQRRLVLEHDETFFHLGHALALHRRTGARVVYDHHHHRCHPAPGLASARRAVAAALATWPAGVRPKVHLSSPRTELRLTRRRRAGAKSVRLVAEPPRLSQHADFVTPWDLSELLRVVPDRVDIMLEAKAKDLAVLWLRRQLVRVLPHVGAAEELQVDAAGAAA